MILVLSIDDDTWSASLLELVEQDDVLYPKDSKNEVDRVVAGPCAVSYR